MKPKLDPVNHAAVHISNDGPGAIEVMIMDGSEKEGSVVKLVAAGKTFKFVGPNRGLAITYAVR